MNVLNEEIGASITKNPQVIDLWVFAAYNEAENNLNIFAARDLFQRCIRINGSSDIKAYIEYFSFEIKFVEKMVERRNILLGKDKGLNVIYGSGEDKQSIQKQETIVDNTNLDDEDEVMKLKIPQIIYLNCLSQYEGKLKKGEIASKFLKALLANSSNLGGREKNLCIQLENDIRSDSLFMESLKIDNIRFEITIKVFFTEMLLMKHKIVPNIQDYIQVSDKMFGENLSHLTSYEQVYTILKFLEDFQTKQEGSSDSEISKLIENSKIYNEIISSDLIIKNLQLPLTIELLEILTALKMNLASVVNEDLIKSIKSNISNIDIRFLFHAYNYALDHGLDLLKFTQEICLLIKPKGLEIKKASSLIKSIVQQIRLLDSSRITDHLTIIIKYFYVKLDNISVLKAASESIISSIYTFILETANPDICQVDKSEFTELKSVSTLLKQVNKPKLINTDNIISGIEKSLLVSYNSNTRVDAASKKILVSSITKMLLI